MINNIVFITQIAGGAVLYIWIISVFGEISTAMRLFKHRLGYWSGWNGPICETYIPTGEVSPLHDPTRTRRGPIGLFKVYASAWRIGKWAGFLQILLISKCFLLWSPTSWWSVSLYVLLVALSSVTCIAFSRALLFSAPFVECLLIRAASRFTDISQVSLQDRQSCLGIIKMRRAMCHGFCMLLTGIVVLFITWIFPGNKNTPIAEAMKHPVVKPISKADVESFNSETVIFFENVGGRIEPWNQPRYGIELATLRTSDAFSIVAVAMSGKGFEPPNGQKLSGLLTTPSFGDKFSIPELKVQRHNAILYVGTISDLEEFRKRSRKITFISTIVAVVLLFFASSKMRRMKTWLENTVNGLRLPENEDKGRGSR